jgi:hypothetical protein
MNFGWCGSCTAYWHLCEALHACDDPEFSKGEGAGKNLPSTSQEKTSFKLSEQVAQTEGSMREIAKQLNISASYVCALKRARENCALRVMVFWEEGFLPFEIVRQLAYLPKKEQLHFLRVYKDSTLGKTKEQRGVARKAMLASLKKARKGC